MEEKKTAMEISIEEGYEQHKYLTRRSILKLLDFVEKWNKQDEDREVANATEYIRRMIE